jgi:hypothetical protein
VEKRDVPEMVKKYHLMTNTTFVSAEELGSSQVKGGISRDAKHMCWHSIVRKRFRPFCINDWPLP